MEQESAHTVLQRLLRTAGEAVADTALTPTRVLRLAMARAAEASVGLSLSVLSVTEEITSLDTVLEGLTPEMMLLALGRGGRLQGLAALDLQLRTATVEMQTVGKLRKEAAAERRITAADAALCAPLITAFLADLDGTAMDTALEGWVSGAQAGSRIENARAAGMMLEDRDLRLVRLSLELSSDGRQAELRVALPAVAGVVDPKPKDKPKEFSDALRSSVMEAPCKVHAVLHRFRMTLQDVEGFDVGQVVSLPGVTVGSVRLEGPNGKCVGHARLGQVTGLRAVRIEQAGPPVMAETILSEHLEGAMAVAGLELGVDVGADPQGLAAADFEGSAGMDALGAQPGAGGAAVDGAQGATAFGREGETVDPGGFASVAMGEGAPNAEAFGFDAGFDAEPVEADE